MGQGHQGRPELAAALEGSLSGGAAGGCSVRGLLLLRVVEAHVKERLAVPVATVAMPAVAECWQLLPQGAGSPVPAGLWLQLCLHAAWSVDPSSSLSSRESRVSSMPLLFACSHVTEEPSRTCTPVAPREVGSLQAATDHVLWPREQGMGIKPSHVSGISCKRQHDTGWTPGAATS